MLGLLTGGDKFVVRGGYARTHDYAFLNLALNVASSFPFVAAINNSNFPDAFTRLPDLEYVPGSDPNLLTRTVVAEDFRAPEADQFSLEFQRELTGNTVFRIGYVGTQGHGLYQTVDGNPRQPFCGSPCTTARASIRRAASSGCAPTPLIRATTRCRPASTSGSAPG